MAKPGKPAAAEAEAPQKPKNKKVLLAVVGVLLLGGIGGGGWYFIKSRQHDKPKPVVVEQPTFLPLESFTVNLQREESDQFLQIGITLKLANPEFEEKVKQHLPEVRSRLLFLLSSKRASELMPIDGKKKLARDIVTEVNAVLSPHAAPAKTAAENMAAAASAPEGVAPAPSGAAGSESGGGVLDVLFTSFIIQ